jgi:hypothetical protein
MGSQPDLPPRFAKPASRCGGNCQNRRFRSTNEISTSAPTVGIAPSQSATVCGGGGAAAAHFSSKAFNLDLMV